MIINRNSLVFLFVCLALSVWGQTDVGYLSGVYIYGPTSGKCAVYNSSTDSSRIEKTAHSSKKEVKPFTDPAYKRHYDIRPSIRLNNVELEQVIDEIMNQSEYDFFYSAELFEDVPKVTIDLKKVSLETLLKNILPNNFIFEIREKEVIIKKKLKTLSAVSNEEIETQQIRTISGTITDSDGNPLPGASIFEDGTSNGTVSDFDGKYTIELENDDAVLKVSFIGFVTSELSVGSSDNMDFSLIVEDSFLDEIVITALGISREKKIVGICCY